MKIFTNILILLFIVVILSKCDSQTHIQEAEMPSLEQISGFYTFQVNRIAEHPAVQFPTDTLSEDQYQINSTHKKYEVLFSCAGNKISIQCDSIVGQRSYQSNQLIKYNLEQGVLAGGRFIVRVYGQSLEAELTIYGSGVPITVSERGKLNKEIN